MTVSIERGKGTVFAGLDKVRSADDLRAKIKARELVDTKNNTKAEPKPGELKKQAGDVIGDSAESQVGKQRDSCLVAIQFANICGATHAWYVKLLVSRQQSWTETWQM